MTNFRAILIRLFLLLIIFQQVTVISAQKVAVVLSGGASRGGAHIGVLKALEENNIPIDYIVGTSIGAVIGGLYASGYTPDEILKIISSHEFQLWADGNWSERYNYYFRADDPNASWVTTTFDFSRKLSGILPGQLVKTEEIDLQILRMFAGPGAVCKGNFDSLMIPFRCVVADIDSSRAMAIRSGDPGKAIRASMSIPLLFNPVEINDKLVFDGGIYNNFPGDIALREFKPDVIIGSRVAQRFSKPGRDDMVGQLLRILMERQNDTINFPASVTIIPSIPDIKPLDFTRTTELADSGYQATVRNLDRILNLVEAKADTQKLANDRIRFKSAFPPMLIDSIIIKGVNKAQTAYLIRMLKHDKPLVSFDEFFRSYFLVLDEGFIKMITPSVRYNPQTSYYDITLDITLSNNFGAQFGGNFSIANTSEAFVQLQYKYLWNKALKFYANGYFGQVYSSARFNGRIDFNSKHPWFSEISYTYNHFNYSKSTTFFFYDKTPGYIISWENFGRISAGIPLTRSGKLSLGFTGAFTYNRYYQNNQFSRTDTADLTTFDFFAPHLTFELNSLNKKQFANGGVRLMARLTFMDGMEMMTPGSTAVIPDPVQKGHQWLKLQVIYDNYFQSLGKVKLGFYGEGVISNQPLFSNYVSSLIYATPFQPVAEAQIFFLPPFRALSYASAGFKLIWNIHKRIDYRLEGYIFQPYQEITQDPATLTATLGKPFADRAYIASTALVYHSPLGPVSLTANYFDKMADELTINFTIGFIIFNDRAQP